MEPVHASRRPSYGSRNGERLSFTGKESAAAADAMKVAAAMALLEEQEESSSSEELSQKAKDACDENILHDVCSHNPPRDVIELLVAAMRHRRGSTCGRDENGRTPLHVAVASGASSGVIDALTRADPLAATMGDVNHRSPLHLAVKYLAYDERYIEQHQHIATTQPSSKKPIFTSKQYFTTSAHLNLLAKEEAIQDTRRIVVILKNAMMTYPGQIDFKDEDSTGFAPIDYAIDGSITDRVILRSLIRRDKSQELRRRSSLQSQSSDKTSKTRNALASKFTKQGSASTFGTKNSLQRRRRSTQSGSSVSSHDSMHSRDKELVHQIEREEMEERRHKIYRLNSRNKTKKTKQVKSNLFDVFGIEELASAHQPGEELDKVEVQQEEQPDTDCGHLDDTLPRKQTRSRRHSLKSSLSFSMTTQGQIETAELTLKETRQEGQQDAAAQQTTMTEKEMEMYNLHLQAYLADSMRDDIGDIEYCDDLDFLLHDPDDDEPSLSEPELEIPVFEIIFPICIESAPQMDDCSEVTLCLLSITS
jgi:hypothetical protein